MSSKKSKSKSETYTNNKSQETLKQAAGVTIETAAKKVTEAQLAIGKTLSDVTNQLQTQLQELNTVTQAVEVKKQELETIHGKEQVLKNIDELQVEYEQHKQNISDQKQNLERERQQEMADYQFNLEQTRKANEVTFEEADRLRKNQQRDEDEQREKAFQLREESLKKQENEFVELRKQVAEFPNKLDAEVKKAEAIVGNSVKREYEHKLQLLQKDFDSAKLVNDNTIKGLQSQLVSSDKVITELTAQLTAAQNKVSEIAKEALQSASNTKSLADVKDFMQSQSNNQPAKRA